MVAHVSDRPLPSYRPCVGIMLLNPAKQIFVGQRIDTVEPAWQMPQGGIDRGEEPRTAGFREMKEEIGTDHAELLAESRHWLAYDLPGSLAGRLWKGKYTGQTQKWLAFAFTGQDSDINLQTSHPELQDWRWVGPEELLETIVTFKRDTYRLVLEEFKDLLA